MILAAEQNIRLHALDPNLSFIVQAPAGSGKTELLTQRYLHLLSLVNEPEEIIAISFTRKAATEMRERILAALALTPESIQNEYQRLTFELAQAALKIDRERHWKLSENPGRLRILTIDALCVQLSSQMPLLSRLTTKTEITENAHSLYQRAVQTLFNKLDQAVESTQALKELLLQLDNRSDVLEDLLIALLAKREQWLSYVIPHHQNPEALRLQLESGLKEIVSENLIKLGAALDPSVKPSLLKLIQFSATQLSNETDEHPLCTWLDLENFPDAGLEYYSHWNALANLLLLKDQRWRSSFDKRQGFPSEAKDKQTKISYKEYKDEMKAISAKLYENPYLHELLCNLLNSPSQSYSDSQWKMLKSLIKLLPLLTAELHLLFQEENVIDFIELNLGALRALGSPEDPTDLALHLDYQIRHLLVDEFQDTSLTQFKLIELLIAQWTPSDGHSLFLVGDPMQSIYRFRNAEVGLFLRAQQEGIAQLKPEVLRLQFNYRSDTEIVKWVNQIFSNSFPDRADITLGAIPYSESMAIHQHEGAGVHYYPLLETNSSALKTVDIIQGCRQLNPESRVAILVRSRYQLRDIIPALHQAGLKFKAVELESLSDRMEIEDLFSLTRALLHLGDRSAWLSLLRAPWCGLNLKDLLIVSNADSSNILWKNLIHFKDLTLLSEDAYSRLNRVVPILDEALTEKGRLNKMEWIKRTWLALGGPACLFDPAELVNAEHYFDLLSELDKKADFSLNLLHHQLEKLYAHPNPEADDSLQIMTIHKAKGLEFDHVILPHLESATQHEGSQLLRWLERPRASLGSDLILAPMKTASAEKDSIYDYLFQIEKKRLDYEMARLLYVATSRAKLSLHLLQEVELDENQIPKAPSKRSFMHHLWPEYESHPGLNHLINQMTDNVSVEKVASLNPRVLWRLSAEWQLPLKLKLKCL